MTFPKDYPLNPPELKFISTMWHPNIYPDGRVCISILHPPGDDPMNPYETAAERWSPVHTVESIVKPAFTSRMVCFTFLLTLVDFLSSCPQLVSVISLLSADTPNTESPANVDAAKEVREDIAGYRKKVRRLARRSAEEAYD